MNHRNILLAAVLLWVLALTFLLWNQWVTLILFFLGPMIIGAYLGFSHIMDGPPKPSAKEPAASEAKQPVPQGPPKGAAPPPRPPGTAKPPGPPTGPGRPPASQPARPSVPGSTPVSVGNILTPAMMQYLIKSLATVFPHGGGQPTLEEKILPVLCEMFEVIEGQIYFVDPRQSDHLELKATYPPNPVVPKRSRFQWTETSIETVLRDASQYFAGETGGGQLGLMPPVTMCACTPLVNGDKTFGVFILEKTARPFALCKPDPMLLFSAGQVAGCLLSQHMEIEVRKAEAMALKKEINQLSAHKHKLESTAKFLDKEVDRQYFEKVDLEKERSQLFSSFQKFVSPIIIDRIMSDPNALKLGGVKQPVTIFFSDIRGFTKMSEKMDPTHTVALLNEYFSEMTSTVYKYEGTLDKFVGDEIMVLFGAPLPISDAPLRAVLCAIEMRHKLDELKAKWQSQGFPLFEIGIGLNTGEVTVGFIGSDKVLSYTAIGDAVNLASRLCATAQPKQILVSAETAKDLGEFIKLNPLEPIFVKGKEQPVQVIEIGGIIKLPAFATEDGLPPLVSA